ncbi:MAG: ABC transporter permease [Halobaculum sp.]
MSDDTPTFEQIDWSQHSPNRVVLDYSTVGFLLGLAGVVGSFLYDFFVVPDGIVLYGLFAPTFLDWLAMLSVLLLVFYVVVPLVREYELTLRYWRRLRTQPAAVLSLGYLLVFALVGLFGPAVYGPPSDAPLWASLDVRGGIPPSQPPAFTSTPVERLRPFYCGVEPVGGRCRGTIVHPLGTTSRGRDVLGVVIAGARLALKVAVITATLLVPLGTAVGAAAAYYGGWVDTTVTRYLDLQSALPSFLIYFFYQSFYGPSVGVLILLFGLLGWDRVARRVRSDALRLRDAGFVRSAEVAGSPPAEVVRRHLVPNVVATVVSALTIQLPFILLMEATLAFFGLVQADTNSWGRSIDFGLSSGLWWELLFPAAALVATVVALATLGNGLYDTFETRREA